MKEKKSLDTTTEDKIKEAARKVFYRKGFAATRTRDIAEEAGINLALLNYYFRSKQKLFELIMMEALGGLIKGLLVVLNDEHTTLEEKIQKIVARYIDVITEEPEIPTFIVSEVRNNPRMMTDRLPIREVLDNSVFFRQHRAAVAAGSISEPNPIHFFINLLGLVVFPFIVKPILMAGRGIDNSEFNQLMQERKKLVPVWIKMMMGS
ncbi:hypothetical protein GCM10023091_29600 [Ravibacter arvi]|uniref:HTH tetR-type domain-containing protein n=1 Tax=Ravibacter arvi TaxID=2051041 RepID=A0ABP8M473_9BACT